MATRSVSLRLDAETADRLDRESRRAGQSRARFLKTLLEEALRMEAHPGIVFRSGPAGRRPGLADGPDVWEVASAFQGSTQINDDELVQVAETTGVGLHQARTALRYYAEYKAEIDEWIRSNDEEAAEAEADWLREKARRAS